MSGMAKLSKIYSKSFFINVFQQTRWKEALLHYIYHMEKYLGPKRGTPLEEEYVLERKFAKDFMCDLLIQHIALKAQTASWSKLWFPRPKEHLSI